MRVSIAPAASSLVRSSELLGAIGKGLRFAFGQKAEKMLCDINPDWHDDA